MAPVVENIDEIGTVPKEEWPYELPQGWKWVHLGDVVEINPPKTLPDSLDELVSFIPMSAVSETKGKVEHLETKIASDVIKGYTSFIDGDILFAKITPCMENGKAAIVSELENKIGYGSTEFYVLRTSKYVDSHFVFQFIRSEMFRDEAKQYMTGAVGQQRVPKHFLEEHIFPLPPLDQQQSIVQKTNHLFAKLDSAKDLVQSARDSSETRKAAILHKAFTGELTAKWRKDNKIKIGSWQRCLFDECIAEMQNGLSKRSSTVGKNTVVLRLADVSDGFVSTKDLRSILLDDEEISKYKLDLDDVLMIRVNGSKENIGKMIYIDNNNSWTFCDHLIRIKFKRKLVLPKFMIYFSQTKEYKDYINENMVSSAGQNTISRKGLSSLYVNVPGIKEQIVIVSILDRLLSNQSIVGFATIIKKIEDMKRCILKQAFWGKL